MPTLKQLKTFIAVADYKKMSDAAKKLYISQPTVSQIISDLESLYGLQFFERFPKELKITPAGTLFLNYAREIVASHENLDQAMKNIHSLRPLRVGATLTIGNTMISEIIATLKSNYPDIDVTVLVDNTKMLEHALTHNELDIALVEGIIVREELLTEPFMTDSLQLICGRNHPFASREVVSIEELRNQNFIMREKGSGTRAIFENIMLAHHIPFCEKWECCSGTAIIDAVRRNHGLGILSSRCIQEYVEKGDLHICQIKEVTINRNFFLCYHQNRMITSQIKNFMETVWAMPQNTP